MSNSYETAGRLRKAQMLHAHLNARGITAEHLENMHPQILAHHAAAAGVREPSDDTVAMVHSMLTASANTKQPKDPFEGL